MSVELWQTESEAEKTVGCFKAALCQLGLRVIAKALARGLATAGIFLALLLKIYTFMCFLQQFLHFPPKFENVQFFFEKLKFLEKIVVKEIKPFYTRSTSNLLSFPDF